jgi:hypothetical protein
MSDDAQVCERVCVGMYMCMYTHALSIIWFEGDVHMYVRVCIHMQMYVRVCIHVHMCVRVCIHVQMYVRVCIHVLCTIQCQDEDVQMSDREHFLCICMCIRTYMYITFAHNLRHL